MMGMMLPIVLHPGLLAFGERRLGPVRISSFPGIGPALERRGWRVIHTQSPPTAGIATRAAALKEQILLNVADGSNGARCIIVGHSTGGLDARYMISKLGMAHHVAALLTVSTPHRGTAYADWVVGRVLDPLGWAFEQ